MNTSKVAIVTSAVFGKVASITGYFFAAVFILILVLGLFDNSQEILGVWMLIPLAFSIFLITKGYKIKQRLKRFKRYVSLISTQHMSSLENIAVSTAQSADFVKKDMQKMIDKKFFVNAVIDEAAKEIVIGGKTASAPASVSVSRQTQTTEQSELEKYTCSGCGASGTKPKGTLSICEYCGSTVK